MGKKCWTSKILKVDFGEHTTGRTQVFGWLPIFKSGVTSDEGNRCSGLSSMSKTDTKIWHEWNKLSLKTDKSLCDVTNMCELHLGYFRAFWKTIYCPGLWGEEELRHYVLGPSRAAGEKPKTTSVNYLLPQKSRRHYNEISYHHDWCNIAELTFQISNSALHKIMQMMAQSLGLLCNISRTLFWREQN